MTPATGWLARLDAWLARQTLKAYEECARLEIEANAREREAIREYFDEHWPSPHGAGWARRE